jgi:lipopolysaccharide transport system ATP-binding protein
VTQQIPADALRAVADKPVGPPAIVVTDVGKRFKLFSDRRTNLKEAFIHRRRRTRFQEFWAVRGISLEIPRGSTFGLVGHNGSGKSTLLKLIAGIHRPTEGDIVANGRITAMLELGAGFHQELSGRDNIYLNGAILGLTKKSIDNALEEIIEFSGLHEFIDVPVKVYSSGMYVRLGFAIAVTLDPEILVIDEIIAVGDEEFQRRCFDYLHKLRKRGVTIIFVTHSMGLVRQLCDGAAWLEHGTLKAVGTADEVVNAYLATVNAAEAERLADEHAAAAIAVGAVPEEAPKEIHDRGSGEVTIERVEFIGGNGAPVYAAQFGLPLTIRLHYSCQTPVDRVVFGLSIRHESGAEVTGPNTRGGGLDDVSVRTDGFVDYQLDPLTINAGTYIISAAAVDHSMLHTFDYWRDAAELVIREGNAPTQNGFVVLDGSWSVSPNGAGGAKDAVRAADSGNGSPG